MDLKTFKTDLKNLLLHLQCPEAASSSHSATWSQEEQEEEEQQQDRLPVDRLLKAGKNHQACC